LQPVPGEKRSETAEGRLSEESFGGVDDEDGAVVYKRHYYIVEKWYAWLYLSPCQVILIVASRTTSTYLDISPRNADPAEGSEIIMVSMKDT